MGSGDGSGDGEGVVNGESINGWEGRHGGVGGEGRDADLSRDWRNSLDLDLWRDGSKTCSQPVGSRLRNSRCNDCTECGRAMAVQLRLVKKTST
jgi:hypothetical protein